MKKSAKKVDPKLQLQDTKPNSAWAFELDPVHPWAFWEQAFTPEECNQIIEIGNGFVREDATTRGGNKDKIRRSEISWLHPCNETAWIYRRMTDVVTELNERFFKFDLFGTTEGLQFTRYSSPSGKYGRHVDSSSGTLIRKLSFTVQLTDPKRYTGGDVCLYLADEPDVMKKDQGCAVLFPSYVLHEVKPVTKGTRYSLVSWITGKPFK